MLGVMLQKLWHKKWMSFCLFIGITLLIATAVSFPMYRGAALDRLLEDEFDQYFARTGEWPAMNTLTFFYKRQEGIETLKRMNELLSTINEDMGVEKKETITYLCTTRSAAHSTMERDDISDSEMRIASMSGIEEHISLLAGEMYSESGYTDDGCLEVLVSQSCLVSSRLLLGETVEFLSLLDENEERIRAKIVGVYQASEPQDIYWQITPESMIDICLIRSDVFEDLFLEKLAGKFNLTCSFFPMWEYKNLRSGQVGHIREYTRYLHEESPYRNNFRDTPYPSILDSYSRKESRIDASLFLLQVPVWILLGAFLFMISTQMYDVERNEISVMKSRGSSGIQIFLLYFYQSVFLTLLGFVGGFPLGRIFAMALGATGSFLEFKVHRVLHVTYTGETVFFGVEAALGCILMITLPAVKHSRLSIVHLKQQKAARKRSWWEICFLDVICLGVAAYGYYSFASNPEAIEESVLRGEAMDPLLYISSSLFIVGMGLLLLRLQPLLIHLVYLAGKRFWSPAAYISFMENRKNGRKQQFIMLFLILAISLGIFHSVTARTILENARENASYLAAADLIVKEIWQNNSSLVIAGESSELHYYEPDFAKYSRLDCAGSYTKVIYDTMATASVNQSSQGIVLMGIHTREFGEITNLSSGLLQEPYRTYLNRLAVEPEGILVSSSFRDVLGCRIGDTVLFSDKDRNSMRGKIVDFVDYWPGFENTETWIAPDGSVNTLPQYLVVANIGTLTGKWGVVPYEVWIGLKDGAQTDSFYQWLEDENVKLEKYVDRQAQIDAVEEDPLLQGTNGILTMGFLVMMLLCAAGYLIYWILSIRSREMIFGILRADGMHRKEIFHLLINEQIFCGGFAVAAGTAIGYAASRMFVPILQLAYAASNQVLPLRLITQRQDMIRLYLVIGIVLVVCLFVLAVLIRRMDVAKALKLGEE